MTTEKSGSKGTHSAKTIGILLAGGKSSRMGENKALLQYKGVRLVDFMSTLLESVVDTVIVSGDIENIDSISDKVPDLGPIGGICSVIEQIECEHILIIPVDMPFLTTATLERLLQQKERGAVQFTDYELPVLLHNNDELKGLLNTIISLPQEERSIRTLLDKLNPYTLGLSKEERREFLNINNPEDFERAEKR